MDIPKAFRGNCECGRWLFIPVGHKTYCECGLVLQYRDDTSATLVISGYSNPALHLSKIATYTPKQQEILEILRLHPRNTETIAWGWNILHHPGYHDDNYVLNILLELQSLGAVDVAFTLGDFTYWVLGRGGLTHAQPDRAETCDGEDRAEVARQVSSDC
jgi:hypothetical protein